KLADFHAGYVRLDWLELAAILRRRVGLEVVHVHVRRPTVEVDHDDGLAPPRRACGACRPQTEQVRQAQPAHRQRPRPEEATPRQHGVRAAERQHGTSSPKERLWPAYGAIVADRPTSCPLLRGRGMIASRSGG